MTRPTRIRALNIGAFLLATVGATALLVAAGLAEARALPSGAAVCHTCLLQGIAG